MYANHKCAIRRGMARGGSKKLPLDAVMFGSDRYSLGD
jgi:hypothetical protein